MREIKFRCWCDNQMQKVSSIDFQHKKIKLFASDTIDSHEGVLMQYTGLKDKNGKEIYEGDIIDIHQTVNGENVFIIEITNTGLVIPSYRFNRNIKYQYNVRELLEVNEYEKEIEVIGNIYENPELLKE